MALSRAIMLKLYTSMRRFLAFFWGMNERFLWPAEDSAILFVHIVGIELVITCHVAIGLEFGGEDFSVLELHVMFLVEAMFCNMWLVHFLEADVSVMFFQIFTLSHHISTKYREGGHLCMSPWWNGYSNGHSIGGPGTLTSSVAIGNNLEMSLYNKTSRGTYGSLDPLFPFHPSCGSQQS